MVNQLNKYQPRIAEPSKPLRDLLSSESDWSWGDAKQQAFSALKQSLASTPTLAHCDASRPTTLLSDSSSYGLGPILIQKEDNDDWRPVAYASQVMSPTEQRYAHIEKEVLGITWGSERLADYLIGLRFLIETDHRSLVALLGTKNLEDLPARIQRLIMRMMRFTYIISHVPCTNLNTSDTLSRAPIVRPLKQEEKLTDDVKAYVDSVIK